ncbi:hypothetical protein F4778DRAFT_800168 [Xylariomycetidae sp. FL2044]|nr:hypothetical protein F4778DRAFT_802566 [Xylariomycetidae sp. FL2044]KAH9883292.1 hypothetical protein F4778DRAFT_788740 [Xylariomycetidae sp. FL2044]KAH9884378.1 hypothetical protein F4778DRAFT_800168 [Xylariomycetidae sp. FL2044]
MSLSHGYDPYQSVPAVSMIHAKHIVGLYCSDIEPEEVGVFVHGEHRSLESLVDAWNGSSRDLWAIRSAALFHILSGFDYLAANGLVYRDAEPATILYGDTPSGYHFVLADLNRGRSQPRTRGQNEFPDREIHGARLATGGRLRTTKEDIIGTPQIM